MGKKRSLDSKIRSSQSFSTLTYRQRDLWHGLISSADDQGRLPGSPAFVRSRVWPFDDIDIESVDSDLSALEKIDCIVRYSNKQQAFIQLVNWWKYQVSQWAATSDYPAPDGWQDRARYNGKGKSIVKVDWDKDGGFIAEHTETDMDVHMETDMDADLYDNDKDKDNALDKDGDKDNNNTREGLDVVVRLEKLGVSKSVSEELAEEFSPELIDEKLLYGAYVSESKMIDPGWYVSAIREDYPSPSGYKPDPDSKAARKRYSKLLDHEEQQID